ncbi:MAG TPA: hypothetical protein PLP29_15770 [Candidatus Ozemobacteraceae bacterium]|nr:hypothetical protein [Candidatus Ozemobacteraceae bacterium]
MHDLPRRPSVSWPGAASLIALGLLVMGCAVRFAVHDELTAGYLFFYYPSPISDMAIHLDLARSVTAGHPAQAVLYTNPGYYHLLALVLWLGGDQETIFSLQMLIGASLGPFLFLTLRRAGFGMAAAAFAGAFLALNQSFVFLEQFLLLEPIHAACFTMLIAALIGLRPGRSSTAAVVLPMAALHLLRPNIVLFWPVVLWRARRRGCSGRALALMIALWLPVLFVAPALTWLRSGECVFSTQNLGDNFFIGNHAGANGTFQAGEAFHRTRKEAEALPPAERTSHWIRAAIRSWDSPWGWIRLTLRKVALVWGPWELPSNVSLQAMEEISPTLAGPVLIRFGTLAPLGLAGMFLLLLNRNESRKRDLGKLLLAGSLVLTLMIAVFFVLGRYRLPLAILLAIGAGQAIATFVSAPRARWGIILAVLGLWLLVNGPLDQSASPAITPYGFPPRLRY